MSYYSDVAIACYEKDFKEFVSSHSESDLFRGAEIHTQDAGVLVLEWHAIKWDTCRSEVKEFTKWLETVPHHFTRVGETTGDVEDYSANDEGYAFAGLIDVVTDIVVGSKDTLCFEEYLSSEGISLTSNT